MRIISLLASGTEIVCGLGAGEALVGRSHECDNPEWVTRLPCCTHPAFDIEASSREIDEEVRRRIRCGEPLYHVDVELMQRLQPDLLISQEVTSARSRQTISRAAAAESLRGKCWR